MTNEQANNDVCPLCKSADMVMGMGTGNIKIYGCLKCSNAQGAHRKMSDAKKAWKAYKATFEEPAND